VSRSTGTSKLAFLEIPTADSAYPKSARADLGDCEETSGRELWLADFSRTCHDDPDSSETSFKYSFRRTSVISFLIGWSSWLPSSRVSEKHTLLFDSGIFSWQGAEVISLTLVEIRSVLAAEDLRLLRMQWIVSYFSLSY
jgi:hypothetical protein